MKKTINDVKILEFQELGDERGRLVVGECGKEIPFIVKRVFYIYGSDSTVVRGRHANRKSEFILVNVAGRSKVDVEDIYGEKKTFLLDRPHMGLYLPKLIWKDMYEFSADSVLLCMSNELYDAQEYIRNYEDFRMLRNMRDVVHS